MTDPAAALEPYLRALLDENRHINLTAVRDLDAARVLHVLDSLEVGALDLPPPKRCLDLGTGNGFPGVALTVLYPDTMLILLDRTRKKLDAIRRVAERAGLPAELTTVHADAEQAPRTHPALRGAFDLVTVRAVGGPDKVGTLAAPFVAAAGHLVLWLDSQTVAPKTLAGLRLRTVHEYRLPEPAPRERRLACYARR